MAIWLRHGTELVSDPAERVRYITAHTALWRAGWCLWIAAAISLVAFYAWWAGRLHDSPWAIAGVAVAAAGLVCDIAGESLLIGWLPRDYASLAPIATQLMGAAANGLYTVGGVILTLLTPGLDRRMRGLTWAVWVSGACVTASTIGGMPLAVAISTTALFALFCLWVLLLGRALHTPSTVSV